MAVLPIINQDTSQIWRRLNDKIEEPKSQRRLILFIVCVALLLDNMLYMVIVPIIPQYLRSIDAWYTHTEGGNMSSFVVNATVNGVVTNRTEWRRTGGHIVYEGEESAVGVLFASKAIVQLFINPFSGALIDRIGYDIPMMFGLSIMFLSTAIFACGKSYGVLFFARSLQGVGSAFADTSGLAMIADRFTEESERTKALGIALAFISFGCLVAPPFGGLLYEFAGKEVPFIILSLVSLIDGILLLFVMQPVKQQMRAMGVQRPAGTPIWRLFIDPYIAVAAGALMMSNVSLAFLEPTISIWMKDNMHVDDWQIGLIWLPAFFPHVAGVYLTVRMARQYPQYQWAIACFGLALEGLSSFIVPFARSYWVLIIPLSGICFGIAQVDTSLLPTLGYLVDVRYVSVYGSIYAIADISYSLAYAIGPIIAGGIVESIGFTALNIFIAISNLLYCPLLMSLRHIYDYKPFESEANILMQDPPAKEYQTYRLQDGAADPLPVTNHVQQTSFMEGGTVTTGQGQTQQQQHQLQQLPAAGKAQTPQHQQQQRPPHKRPAAKKHVRVRGYRSSDMEMMITSSEEEEGDLE
ncbi:vesicular acetylcholine transporter isoform X2 [Dermacentor andersoni]|uniref:vesicular acetylcholine transporter isoform X2 n=1 Tax=Dermacentor andersoni TaxID=34620 RepID=UPI0021558F0F|nr:vesicular acetylcholine transporter-like isoform X2 [Dermacentor andersoni]